VKRNPGCLAGVDARTTTGDTAHHRGNFSEHPIGLTAPFLAVIQVDVDMGVERRRDGC
jgi:hypothetical protein